jgi:hypothetical protein
MVYKTMLRSITTSPATDDANALCMCARCRCSASVPNSAAALHLYQIPNRFHVEKKNL